MFGTTRRSRIKEKISWTFVALACFALTVMYKARNLYAIEEVLKQTINERSDASSANNFYSLSHHNDQIRTNYIAEPTISTNIAIKLTSLDNNSLQSEWLKCNDLERIYERVRKDVHATFREMTTDGNRAVYFTTIANPVGERVNVALKVATVFNPEHESDVYRYRSALREIGNLRKMWKVGWKGIPSLFGACVTSHRALYAVERVRGNPLCSGNGTDRECAMFNKFMQTFQSGKSSSALLWITKVTCFFKQFEKHKVFMEDISGSNFYFSPLTFDIYIVDADSIVFYENSALLSGTSCRSDGECVQPTGNFWGPNALNHKIYFTCRESQPYCNYNKCWGIDASLHNCGIGRWLISPLRTIIPPQTYSSYREIMHCLMEKFPQRRCTMTDACEKAEKLYNEFNQAYHT